MQSRRKGLKVNTLNINSLRSLRISFAFFAVNGFRRFQHPWEGGLNHKMIMIN
jgi:hypothetical protein